MPGQFFPGWDLTLNLALLFLIQDHVSQMAPVVRSLQELESQAQLYYLKMHHSVTIGAK